MVSNKRMPFVAFERGYDVSSVMARMEPDPLPPLREIVCAIRKMGIDPSRGRPKKLPVAFGGSGRTQVGPSLPIQRPRVTSVLPKIEPKPPPEPPRHERQRKSLAEESRGVEQLREPSSSTPVTAPTTNAEEQPAASHDTIAEEGGQTSAQCIEDVELKFPWSEEELRQVFHKFDTDRDAEVHKDEIPAMLLYLGARKAPEEAVRIVEAQTRHATLNYEEFVEFLQKFRDWDVATLREEFKTADKDGSGYVNFDELHVLLQEMGYAPTVQSTMEAMVAIDKDSNGKIDLEEFDHLREHLRKTEGMTKADVAELRELYDKTRNAKGDSTSEPAADEVWRLTTFLGYSASIADIRKLAMEVDEDDCSTLSFQELMKLIRLVREQEKDRLIVQFQRYGPDPDCLEVEFLGVVLADLGYFVSEDAVWEIMDTLGECKSEDSLTFEEFACFMRRYRVIDGFSESELEELEAVFDANKVQGKDALRTIDVSRVLRWFGFSKTVQEVQNLIRWIDFDLSGEIELAEFYKLMRRLTQDESRARHEVFDAYKNKATEEISSTAIHRILETLQGFEPSPDFIDKALVHVALGAATRKKQEGLSDSDDQREDAPMRVYLTRSKFEAFARHYRHLVVEEIHRNAGYSKAEVANLRQIFDQYDKDGSGTVERTELAKMLGEYFPDATKSKEGQEDIKRALAEVDKDGNGELDFDEFLLLMRKGDDARDTKDLNLELQVVKECQLSPDEVEGFRHIFSEHIDWKGELGLYTLQSLLGRVVELSLEDIEHLAALVREVHPQGREVARFPQFLKLIRRLIEDNYNHVNELAARVVKRDQGLRERANKPL